MKIFVIGAGGYVGGVLVEALVAAGHDVVAHARSPGSRAALARAGAQPVDGELAEPQSMLAAARDAEVVIDASRPKLTPEQGPPAYRALLEGLDGQRFILTTGAGLLGDTGDEPADEDAPLRNPSWRSEVEALVLGSERVRGAVIRPGLVYGLGRSIVIAEAIRVAHVLDSGWCIGEGSNRWSAVHVRDLVRLYLLLLAREESTILHAGAEDFAMADMGRALAVGQRLPEGPMRLSPEEAGAMSPNAAALSWTIRISSARARQDFHWAPREPGLLEELRSGSYALTAGV